MEKFMTEKGWWHRTPTRRCLAGCVVQMERAQLSRARFLQKHPELFIGDPSYLPLFPSHH